MAGLLEGVLPWIYSTGDTLKRNVRGLLANPRGFAESIGQDYQTIADQQKQDYQTLYQPGLFTTPADTRAAQDRMTERSMGLLAMPTVYHGSPHTFSKFDASKIGTGEGAQSYGHGLYFADQPAVAMDYARNLSNQSDRARYVWQGKTYEPLTPQTHAISLAYHDSPATARRIGQEGVRAAQAGEPWAVEQGGITYWQQMLDTANQIKSKSSIKQEVGNLYKVNLPDSAVAKMLDWDKPLSQQTPEVQAAVDKLAEYKQLEGIFNPGRGFPRTIGGKPATGQDIINQIGERGGKRAEDWLREQGIPGIRYLDQGSRGSGAGTSNYVVFPGGEGLLNIMERNGQPVEQARGLLNSASQAAASTDNVWFHGSPVDIYGGGGFKLSKGESGIPVVWGVKDPFTAEGYARGEMALQPNEIGKYPLVKSYYPDRSGGGVYTLESTAKNPYIYDAGGKPWYKVPQSTVLKKAQEAGHDAVIFKNIVDEYQSSGGPSSDVIAWLNTGAFKPTK